MSESRVSEKRIDSKRRSAFASTLLPLVLLALSLALETATPRSARAFIDSEVRAIVLNEVLPDSFPGVGGVWMARQRRVEIDGVGVGVIDDHHLARVFEPSWGAENFSSYSIPYWGEHQSIRVERARVWHSIDDFRDLTPEEGEDRPWAAAEGVKPYLTFREIVLHFPPLQSGDVVEVKWTRHDAIPPGEQNVRFAEYLFAAPEPTIESQFTLTVPTALLVKTAERRPERFFAEVRPRGEKKMFAWITGHLERTQLPIESTTYARRSLPGDAAAAESPAIFFSTAWDWPWLSTYYGKRWAHLSSMTDASIGVAVSEVSGKTTDLRDRASRIEAYIQDEIRTLALPTDWTGLKPVSVGEVHRARAGAPRDKALLLSAALGAAGIRSHVVYIRTRTGPWDTDIPCPSQLDRFMVRASIQGGESFWLDPIESKTPLPASLGLVFAEEGDAVEKGLVGYPGR